MKKVSSIFIFFIFLFPLFMGILTFIPNNASATTDNYYPVDDCFTTNEYPTQTSGNFQYMKSGQSGFGVYNYAWIKFDLSSIGAGETISSATLYLYRSSGTTQTNNYYRVTGSWVEETLNWNGNPGISGSYGSVSLASGWTGIDITTMVSEWTHGTYTNYGIMLSNSINGADHYCGLSTKEADGTSQDPYLVVAHSLADYQVTFTSNPVIIAKAGTTYSYQVLTNQTSNVTIANLPSGFTFSNNNTLGTHYLNGTMPAIGNSLSIHLKCTSPYGTFFTYQNFTLYSEGYDYSLDSNINQQIQNDYNYNYFESEIGDLGDMEIVAVNLGSKISYFLRDSNKNVIVASEKIFDPAHYITAFDMKVLKAETDDEHFYNNRFAFIYSINDEIWISIFQYYSNYTITVLQSTHWHQAPVSFSNPYIYHIDSIVIYNEVNTGATSPIYDPLGSGEIVRRNNSEFYNTGGNIEWILGEILVAYGLSSSGGSGPYYPVSYIADVLIYYEWDLSSHEYNPNNITIASNFGFQAVTSETPNGVGCQGLTFGTIDKNPWESCYALFWTNAGKNYYSTFEADAYTMNGTFSESWDDHFRIDAFDYTEHYLNIDNYEFESNIGTRIIQDGSFIKSGLMSECNFIILSDINNSGQSYIYEFSGSYFSSEEYLLSPVLISLNDEGYITVTGQTEYFTGCGFESALWIERNSTRLFIYADSLDSEYNNFNFYRYIIRFHSILNPGYDIQNYSDANLKSFIYDTGQEIRYTLELDSVTPILDTDRCFSNVVSDVRLIMPKMNMDNYQTVQCLVYEDNSSIQDTLLNVRVPSLVLYDYGNDSNYIYTVLNYTWTNASNVTVLLNTTTGNWVEVEEVSSHLTIPLTSFQVNIYGLIWLLITFLPAIILNLFLPKIGFVAGIGIMTIVLGLSMPNYFFITIISLICIGFIIMKGDG